MKPHFLRWPTIAAAAERQMQAWSRCQEITDRLFAGQGTIPTGRRVWPYLAISREAGAGGSLIAEAVGRTLGWEVLGRSLLDQVAQRYQLPRPMLELVDETQSNWAHDILGTWLDSKVVPHEKYVCFLRHVILRAAYAGPAVFIGRGAQFFLPRRQGLAVRIVASEPYRVANLADQRGLSPREAQRVIRTIDHGRREFVARYFRQDIDDPHLYDIVLNVEHRGPGATVDAIVQLCQQAVVEG
ncbi:MAG: cytidylate kinase-like family protein [Pirellulales bacterium]|nr:cytidylate kinase-like family protein [Pirellulales bacterium]